MLCLQRNAVRNRSGSVCRPSITLSKFRSYDIGPLQEFRAMLLWEKGRLNALSSGTAFWITRGVKSDLSVQVQNFFLAWKRQMLKPLVTPVPT